MSRLVLDAIDAELATLDRIVQPPTGALGYGRDLSCVSDLTDSMAEVEPDSTLGIGEAAIRRLTTSRGQLLDDPDYGLNLRLFLNRPTAAQELAELRGRIKAEVGKDDRVEDVEPTVTMTALNALRVALMITPADPSLEPFSLIFAVDRDGRLEVDAIG